MAERERGKPADRPERQQRDGDVPEGVEGTQEAESRRPLLPSSSARTDGGAREEVAAASGSGEGEGRPMRSSTLRGVVALEVLAFLVTVLGLLHIPVEREYMLIFRVFYFPLIPLAAMLWLWGVNVAIWTQYRTNYLKVFEVEDRVVLPCHDDVFKMAHISTLMILASSAFFLFCALFGFEILAIKQAEALYLVTLVLFLLPGDRIFGKQRRFFVSTVFRIAVPLREVSFADFLLADVITSLARPLADTAVVGCRVLSTYTSLLDETSKACYAHSWLYSVALGLPYLWRLIQCVKIFRQKGAKPQLANAVKYFTAFPVIYFSALKYHTSRELWLGRFRPIWIACAVLNSGFSYYWDITRDWDFGSVFFGGGGGGGGGGGEDERKVTGFHKWAVWSNLVLRISWTCKLSAQIRHMYGLSLTLALLEVFRRFQWMFIRIEVELKKDLKGHQPQQPLVQSPKGGP